MNIHVLFTKFVTTINLLFCRLHECVHIHDLSMYLIIVDKCKLFSLCTLSAVLSNCVSFGMAHTMYTDLCSERL